MLTIPRAKAATALAYICFTLSVLVTPSPAHSQWIENGAPVCTAPYVQEDPASVSDGAGGAIIVWSHINTQRDIFAQRIDGDGIPLWTLNGVAVCAASGEQLDPAITSDGAGGAIIVWEDNRSTNTIIFAQRIDADGNPLWTADGIPICLVETRQINPSIVADGAGGAVIACQDYRNGNVSDVYAQRLDAGGDYMWGPGTLVSTVQGMWNKVNPRLVSDGTGGAFFVWSATNIDSWPLLHRARVDDSGVVRWRAYISGPFPAGYGSPAITSCPAGAIIVWSESREDESQSVIYAEKFDTSGAELWRYPEWMWPLRHIKVATSPLSFSQGKSQVIPDGSGGAIVTWIERGKTYDIYMKYIFARRLNADGDTLWAPYGNPACTVFGEKGDVRLVGDGSGGAVITWHDSRGSDADIYAQSIDSNGIIKGPAEGIMVCSEVRDQIVPCITGNGAGGAIIAWEDDRPDWFTDIYAHQVEYDGTVETELLSWSVSSDGAVVRIAWALSSIEEDASFKLRRKNLDDELFVELEGAVINRDGLYFSVSDIGLEPGSTHIYRVIVDDSSGERILFESDPVSVPAMPATLFQNTPNPFNPSTTIRYFIPERAVVVLEIFDVAGRLVEVLPGCERSRGYHEAVWNARGTSSGIYFCRLRAGKISISRKMVLLR